MSLQIGYIILGIIGLFILYILCRIFIKPLKWFLRLILSCLLGCGCMFVVNIFLSPLHTGFAINPLTAAISGVLGVPGMALTLLLQRLL